MPSNERKNKLFPGVVKLPAQNNQNPAGRAFVTDEIWSRFWSVSSLARSEVMLQVIPTGKPTPPGRDGAAIPAGRGRRCPAVTRSCVNKPGIWPRLFPLRLVTSGLFLAFPLLKGRRDPR